MPVNTHMGSLRLGNLGVDILSTSDKVGRKWYVASLPKVYARGNNGTAAKSLERLQIPTAIALLREAEKKLAELETSEPVWEPLQAELSAATSPSIADTEFADDNGNGPRDSEDGSVK